MMAAEQRWPRCHRCSFCPLISATLKAWQSARPSPSSGGSEKSALERYVTHRSNTIRHSVVFGVAPAVEAWRADAPGTLCSPGGFRVQCRVTNAAAHWTQNAAVVTCLLICPLAASTLARRRRPRRPPGQRRCSRPESITLIDRI